MEALIHFVISLIFLSSFQNTDFEKLDKELSHIDGVSVQQRDGNIVVFFEDAMFGSGEYMLSDRAISVADTVGHALNENVSSRFLYIEGHTDNVGSEAFNQSLSEKRAQSVAERIRLKGFLESRVDVVGYGDRYPECSNDTAEGRSCNRRVQIVVLMRKHKSDT